VRSGSGVLGSKIGTIVLFITNGIGTIVELSRTFIILFAAYGHVVQTDPRPGDQGLPPGSKKGCPERGCHANSGHRFSLRHWARLKRPGGQSTLRLADRVSARRRYRRLCQIAMSCSHQACARLRRTKYSSSSSSSSIFILGAMPIQ
jgi:hypothetical protein